MSIKNEVKKTIKKIRQLFPQQIQIPVKYYDRPQVLKIEITNICNSRCKFCAYTKMTRPKVNMDEATFNKVVDDYIAIGGGDVVFSPVVGDVLMNRNCIKYVKKLKETPGITGIWLFTNLLALASYTEEEIGILLDSIDCLGVSTGANREDYKKSFGVDGFEFFLQGVECLVRYKNSKEAAPAFYFSGRAMKFKPEVDSRLTDMYSKLCSVPMTWIPEYYDWSGNVENFGQEQPLVKVDRTGIKHTVCIQGLLAATVFSNGDVGFCQCSDVHAQMIIGNISKNSLADILSGGKRKQYLDAFENGKTHPHCAKCGFYSPLKNGDTKNWIEWINPTLIGNVYKIVETKAWKFPREETYYHGMNQG